MAREGRPAGPPGARTQGPRLILHLSGSLTLHHGPGAQVVRPGTLLLFPASCPYGEESVGPVSCVFIGARGKGVYAHIAERGSGPTGTVRTSAWAMTHGGECLEDGIRFAIGQDPEAAPPGHAHRPFAVRALARFLLDLVTAQPAPPIPAAGPPFVRYVLRVILERSGDPGLSVASLAAAVGRHPSSLTRLIRTTTGSSIIHLLGRARLDRADRLLADPRLTMAEVARRSGFGTERRLRIAWRKEHQIPPVSVRRHAHRAPPGI